MAYEIKPATVKTMAEVEAWLDAEEAVYKKAYAAWEAIDYRAEKPSRGFRCNWDTTKRRWQEGQDRIDILIVDGAAAGFVGSGLFEIRPDLRRLGYGRILADFMITSAFEAGESVMEIDVAPATAEPFWESMGFTLVPERSGPGGGTFGYKVLPRTFGLGTGARVPFRISFYTQSERFSVEPRSFDEFSGLGEQLPNGVLQLPVRAYCFDPRPNMFEDDFARIEVNGAELYFDKVKRSYAPKFGIERTPGYSYFIDRIKPNGSTA